MERRLALVVGISNYPNNPLRNPSNDAESIGTALESNGFEVTTVLDCDLNTLGDALDNFSEALDDYDVGLFFFAGHGAQIDNANYLITTNTDARRKNAAKRTSLALQEVLEVMNESDVATKIVILDACRNDPWQRGWARDDGPRGLASVFAPKGTIIGFATSPGEVADDGAGDNGTYTAALLNHIHDKDRPIEAVFKRVRNDVAAATGGAQTTWEHTSLSGEFYFNMSIAQVVGDYGPSALADNEFVIDAGTFAGRTIRALKSYSWYSQNPAVEALSAETTNALNLDEMFVVGRNVYQAAVGSSNEAWRFIENFDFKTEHWMPAKTKAFLDGMLFEIFFDRDGNLRQRIKGGYFNLVMNLRNNPVHRPSFEFISNCLREARAELYVFPDQNRELGATVTVHEAENTSYMTAIWVNGENILQPEHSQNAFGDGFVWMPQTQDQFEERISLYLKVPTRQLTITYTSGLTNDRISVPYSWTLIT